MPQSGDQLCNGLISVLKRRMNRVSRFCHCADICFNALSMACGLALIAHVPGGQGQRWINQTGHLERCFWNVGNIARIANIRFLTGAMQECGAEYLSAAEVSENGREWLRPQEYAQDEDEFQQGLEPLADDEDENSTNESSTAAEKKPRLLTSLNQANGRNWGLAADGGLDPSGQVGIPVHLRFPSEKGLECPVCRKQDRNEKGKKASELFYPIRVGAPFLLGTAIPTLLEAMPPLTDGPDPRPLDGRRLITFTDSRQGTARIAIKLQQESERDYVRSLLYHSLTASAQLANPVEIIETQRLIAALEGVAHTNLSLA
jgi:DEAD/DEAH box helicase domain-containing protein